MDVFKTALSFVNPPKKDSEKSEIRLPVTDREKEIPPNREVLLTWSSPSRTFRQRSPQFYKKLGSLIFVVSVLLVLAGQFFLIAVLVSIFVLFYVLSSIPPEKVKHEIDNYGIYYYGRQYYWSDFKYYFLTKEEGFDILNVDTREPYPGRMFLILEGVSVSQVKDILDKHLPMRSEPPHTVFDKAFRHVSGKISLE
ncbi:hypothetical protein A2716_03060 [candidate division WWE3 bacterium RIFCSPHIGHO2_01_FULL_40_23]|uniref:DUF5673 domain-containing protein n=1 Tax=candidate division WWE3 bacterium RIFCSPLOWO2_01_FULL_41_18 TaxID=1802625 RepID=A0A1F4VCQ8_UNCKA|nr:MAG: hypothetical protein A2716_03060 [candidate division WWE3 bacterium RIFCSPHIGHO2_01_FULL_40_23]OGC54808.1 MAG: hypothetical protein A3A78_05015 [candidate division WWE3 bacterium RIFCSPLOWO2_01_FULL_41_18]